METDDIARETKKKNSVFHELFEIAILLKGAFGVIELFLGAFILLVNRAAVSDFLLYLVHGELVEDPDGLFANYIANFSQGLSASTESFIGGYFLAYGFIKIFLVAGLFSLLIIVHIVTRSKAQIIFMRTGVLLTLIVATNSLFPFLEVTLKIGLIIAGVSTVYSVVKEGRWFLKR